MMATHLSLEAPGTSAYVRNRHVLPLLQRHGHFSEHFPEIISDGAIRSVNTIQAPPAKQGRQKGAQGVSNGLGLYREQLINLFWEQDLPLRQVQEIMKEEHGLNFRLALTSR